MNYIFNGVSFDTEIEARWAVFLSALGLSWEYKPKTVHTYASGDGDGAPVIAGDYTPTFYINDLWCWAQVDLPGVDWSLIAEALDWGCDLEHFDESYGGHSATEIEKLEELGVPNTHLIKPGFLVLPQVDFMDVAKSYVGQIDGTPVSFNYVRHHKGLLRTKALLLAGYGIVLVHEEREWTALHELIDPEDALDGFGCSNEDAIEFFTGDGAPQIRNPFTETASAYVRAALHKF
jgi:hypothetical protein